ncbi:retrovirus-related pol polyprotein from transposon TNT 1-94 [Tanacetum coccineum]
MWQERSFCKRLQNKVKAKLALLSSSASASKAATVKNEGLIAEAYEWDEEEVSSNDNEMVEVKVLMALAEENDVVNKEGAINGEWVKISMRKLMTQKCPYLVLKDLGLSEAEGFILPNHDTSRILPAESQRYTTDPSVAVTDSSVTDYDSTDESLVYSTPFLPLKKLDGAEPISGPKTIKSILRSKSTFKAKTLKGVIINEPSSTLAKDNKSSSASKVNSAPAGKLKSVKIEDDPPLAICERTDYKTCDHAEYMSTMNMSLHLKSQGGSSLRYRTPRPSKHFFPPCILYGFSDHLSDDCVNYPIYDIYESYDHDTHGHNKIISLRRGIKPRQPQYVMKSCETCGGTVHTITDHNDIEWFRRGEALQAKKAEALKSTKAESSNARSPSGPKVVFGDDSSYTSEGYGSIKCNDVYVLDMTSSVQESCFFAKASENLNWLWHKRLAHLNFKTINSLEKQNLVISLPSLVYSKDKSCSSCIKKCLHLLHMDLFGHVTPRSINHEKYTIVIVDEYSRVFNTRRQQTKEIDHITFDKSPDAIKFTKPLVDNINIAEFERYSPDEYLHPYEPSQSVRGYFSTEYNSNPSLSIPSMVTPAPQDIWSRDKHIELVNIISNLGARMLTRAMAKEVNAASAYECLFVDFLSEEEPKKVSEALQHPGWVDAIQEELNQFARNKV